MRDIRKAIANVLASQYPDYDVVSFDIVSDARFQGIFVAENIRLVGKTPIDGKLDGQLAPLFITTELVKIS